MDEPQGKPPGLAEDADYVLRSGIQPAPCDLGVTYEGAILEGSLHISPAREIRKVHVDQANGQNVLWLSHQARTGRGGLIWRFQARTDRPIKFLAFVGFWTDLGKASTHFSLEVQAGSPPGGRILFCESLFRACSNSRTHRNVNLITRELRVQTNTTGSLPEDLSPFHTVVLHGQGLRCLVGEERKEIDRFLATGGRVVILASYFSQDSVMLANHLLEPHDVRLEDLEYQEVLCGPQHIAEHPLTKEVRRLRWFRPSPLIVKGRAKLLVQNPEKPGEGFVACGGPHQNLFAVGESLLSSLVCDGWPFDNGRLFANLLMKT